jgi:hypothetical protein
MKKIQFILLLFIYTHSLGQTILNPSADAYVNQSSSSTNYGSATTLTVFKSISSTSEKNIYLKFDVTNINLSVQNKVILRLFVPNSISTSSDIGFDAHQISNSTWNENSITFSNKPNFVRRIATSWLWNGSNYIDFDITNFTKQLVGSMLTIGISDNRASNFTQVFYSKESAFKPQLLCYTNNNDSACQYYIANNGNDTNSGLSPLLPWKTLKKVNSINYKPGSTIKFKSGDVWNGQLRPQGIGTFGFPIVIDSFGLGPLPIIDGNGIQNEATVFLYNSPFWELRNLEITNSEVLPQDRRGVEIDIENIGMVNHIFLNGLYIHDIKGIIGSGLSGKGTGGIYFTTLNDNVLNTRFDSIMVENCTIENCDNTGIATNSEATSFTSSGWNYPGTNDFNKRKITNLIFRNNVIHHIGKNAIIVRLSEKGVVEHNVCYETAIGTTGNTIFTRSSKGVVLQFNEGYNNKATSTTGGSIDGSLYDPDYGSVACIFQYSYSHDNSEGLGWFCNCRSGSNNTSGKPDIGDTGTVFRYNVSQNDQGDIFFFNYPSAGNSIYNNVIYVGPNLSGSFIHENGSNDHTYSFYNNIIFNKNSLKIYTFSSSGSIQNRTFSNNLFYGSHPTAEPADPFKIISDPKFVNPGMGMVGIASLDGYKLKSTSPALSSGKIITNNGSKDFYGNFVSSVISPNRGIYQGEAILDTSTLIFDAQKSEYIIYPNPCTNHFKINILDLNSIDCVLQNIDGSIILHPEVTSNGIVDVNDLNRGIYILLLKKKNENEIIFSTKIVLQ